MAIAFQSAVTLVRGTGTSITTTGTFTGSNGILIAAVFTADITDLCSGVTFAGTAMTRINGTLFNSAAYVSLWYLLNPSTTASSSLTATFSSSATNSRVCGAFYTGAAQSGQMDANAVNSNAGGTTITGTVTSVADNCWAVMLAANDSGFGFSGGTATTLRSGGATSDNLVLFDGNAAKTPAGSVSLISNDAGSNSGHGLVIATIAPFIGSTVNSNFLMFM